MSLSRFPNAAMAAYVLTGQLTAVTSLSVPALAQMSYPAANNSIAQVDAETEHTFTLTNETSVDMLGFYASPQMATDWEENVLGDSAIQANGDRTIITLPSSRGCIYDFLAVFADGDKLEKYGINVCDLEIHTYYEN
ncbi:MAG: hypothetical protein ACFB14_23375 [Leptolyngbyaceae cyanobacterium]